MASGKIEIWIKTGHGAGSEFSFNVSALPRVGDNLRIPNVDVIKVVTRIDHDLFYDRVIIYTA